MSKSLIIHDPAGAPIYEIAIEQDFNRLPQKLAALGFEDRKICIIADSHTGPLYSDAVAALLKPVASRVDSYCFPAGEPFKTLDTVRDIYRTLIEARYDRKDCLLALGGGVTGDITGFAASTYLRGIAFVQVPTTLLSQSDSSVGGKTGVDFDGYKNMVGAFCMPRLVYMNTASMMTMDRRDFLSGMGEVVKHGLIMDHDFLQWMLAHRDEICRGVPEILMEMDYRNCAIKGRVVEEDPTEQGIRSLLNFGHTLGHAIEKQKAGTLYHGECVSIGGAAAAFISYRRGYLTRKQLQEVCRLFTAFDLPVSVSGIDIEAAVAATRNDKKVQGRTLRFILLKSLGEAVIDTSVTEAEMREALEFVACGQAEDIL